MPNFLNGMRVEANFPWIQIPLNYYLSFTSFCLSPPTRSDFVGKLDHVFHVITDQWMCWLFRIRHCALNSVCECEWLYRDDRNNNMVWVRLTMRNARKAIIYWIENLVINHGVWRSEKDSNVRNGVPSNIMPYEAISIFRPYFGFGCSHERKMKIGCRKKKVFLLLIFD